MKKTLYLAAIIFFALSCKIQNSSQNFTAQPSSITEYFSYKKGRAAMISVHRGGGNKAGYPENCIESFDYFAKLIPCIIECDIEMTKDSVMVLMHDKTLERTSTGKGAVSSNNYGEVSKLQLKDNNGNITRFKVPTLAKTLEWGKNKVIYTLDVKKTTPFWKVIKMVEEKKAENYAAIITYNLKEAVEVFGLNRNLLISVSILQESDYQRLHDAGIPDKNMLAFIGTREPKVDLIDFLHSKGIMTILGVLGNLDKKAEAKDDKPYLDWISKGADILATDRPEAVFNILKTIN